MHAEKRTAPPHSYRLYPQEWASPRHESSCSTRSIGPLVPCSVPFPTVRKRTLICALFARIMNNPFDILVFIFALFCRRFPSIRGPLAPESRRHRGTPRNCVHFEGVSRSIRKTSPFFILRYFRALRRSAGRVGLRCRRRGSGSGRRRLPPPLPPRLPRGNRLRNGLLALQSARPAAPQ